MPKNNVLLNKFNRGKISPRALGREDLEDIPFFAEEIENYFLETLGNLTLRPGLEYKETTRNSNKAYFVPFVYSLTDKTRIEFTDGYMRVYDGYDAISRPSVSTAFTNGTFDTDVTSWTDADESGAVSVWATGGYLSLTGTGFNYAIRQQTLTVAAEDQNVEHAIYLKIHRGKVRIKVGSSSGGSEYFEYDNLEEGEHSLVFTPTGASVYVQLESLTTYDTLVDSCSIASSGAMEIISPYAEADLSLIRYEQSLDVIYLSGASTIQRKIERRSTRSWSLVKYQPEDGPFRNINTSQITLAPSATTGDITLTASKSLFDSDHVGALFKMTSSGQQVTLSASGENQFTSEITVEGTEREFEVVITGTWTATVTLQRSFDEGVTWRDYTTYTTNTTTTVNDGLTNQLVWYRIGVITGDYTSGTAELTLDYPSGTATGIVRITGYTSATSVSAIVLSELGNTTATTSWYEGSWSDYRGWPSTVKIYDSRLTHAGLGKITHSETDGYEFFSDEVEGNSRSFSRFIGRGPSQNIPWLLSLQRLIIGGESGEFEEKASALDEAITATNANVKAIDDYGSSLIMAQELGDGGVFIDRSGTRVMSVTSTDSTYKSYAVADLMKLVPDLCPSGVTYVRIAVQRRPDTRVHAIRSDGKVDIMIFDKAENVKGWCTLVTDGEVEDAFILPATEEDEVYYCIKRTIDGNTKRYLEEFALRSECMGETLNKQLDSFIEISQSSSTTITGLSHLEGETVGVWANGKDLGTYTVASGQITGVSEAVTSAIVGLPYTATFKSTKLLFAQAGGTAVNQVKRVSQIGLLLYKTHQRGITYSSDGTTYFNMPDTIDEEIQSTDKVWDSLDIPMFPVNSSWKTDSRVYLKTVSPKPCTVLGLTIQMKTNDKG